MTRKLPYWQKSNKKASIDEETEVIEFFRSFILWNWKEGFHDRMGDVKRGHWADPVKRVRMMEGIRKKMAAYYQKKNIGHPPTTPPKASS